MSSGGMGCERKARVLCRVWRSVERDDSNSGVGWDASSQFGRGVACSFSRVFVCGFERIGIFIIGFGAVDRAGVLIVGISCGHSVLYEVVVIARTIVS